MQRFILIRTIHSLIALWVVSVVVFALIRVTGDPASATTTLECNAACVQELREYWGTDKPWPEQYWIYVSDMFKGDFGDSYQYDKNTKGLILERLPASVQLAGVALVISILLGVPLGVISAVKRDTPLDLLGKIIALLGQSLPSFWVGIVLMWIFAVRLDWLPTSGKGGIEHMILPAVTLGWFNVAAILRLVRSSMLEVLDSEYVKLARIKGIPEWKVTWKHCLRNAAITPLTYFAIIGVTVLTQALITERVFVWPGVGSLALDSAINKDFAVIQTLVLMFATIYIVTALAVDILYAYLDPRIRYA